MVFVAIVHEVTVTHYTFLVNYQNPGTFLVLLFLGAVRGYYNGVGIDFLVIATPAKSTTNFSKNIPNCSIMIPFDSIRYFQVNSSEKSAGFSANDPPTAVVNFGLKNCRSSSGGRVSFHF